MSNHSIIEHRANYHYLRMEEDYLAICSNGKCSPHCKAQILSVLESWTNTKKEKGESEYIYLTMPQWAKYTYMLYERNVITDCIKELLDEGMVERRPIIMFDQSTFEYKLMHEVVNRLIKALPPKDPKEVLPRLDAYIAFKEKAKEQARERREAKKLAQESEGAREKSPTVSEKSRTSRVGDKSRTVREKSPGVGEKSTTGYVKNHHILESITNLSLTSTKGDTDTRVAVASATHTSFSQTLVSLHPEHGFLWGDDHLNPTRVVVYLTPAFPSRYYSEVEDKRREQIVAYEVMPYLEAKGLKVSLQWKHETEQEIEQALAANENKTEPVGETAEIHRLTNLLNPVDEKIVNADEAVSRSEAETQERATSSAVIETQGNTIITGIEQNKSNIPIAPEVQQQAEEQPSGKKRTTTPKPEKPSGPPQMPPDDAPWTAETFIQILEAHKGRRYPNGAKRKSDRVRDVEMEAAETLLIDAADLWTEDTAANRELLLKIVTRIETKDNNWWLDRLGPVLPHQLVDKDRIHTVYDELVRMKQVKNLKQQREDTQRKAALDAASRAKKNDEFYQELLRTRREA